MKYLSSMLTVGQGAKKTVEDSRAKKRVLREGVVPTATVSHTEKGGELMPPKRQKVNGLVATNMIQRLKKKPQALPPIEAQSRADSWWIGQLGPSW